MLRNQVKLHEDPSGRWAYVSGAAEFWFVTWSGGPTMGMYRSASEARELAKAWVERGVDPRGAETCPCIEVPAWSGAPKGVFQ